MKTMIRFWFVTASIFIGTNLSLAQWVQTNGPSGGVIQCLAFNGSNLFAGVDHGVFLSTNNGTSWSAANYGLTDTDVRALIVSPNATGGTNLFAGTNVGGVFLSTNNGASWSATNNGLPKEYAYYNYNTDSYPSIRNFEVIGTNLFAGTRGGGVFLSTDNGTNWTEANIGLTNTDVFAFAVCPNGAGGTNLFAGTGGGVFLSTTNGSIWGAVNSGLTDKNVMSLVIRSTDLGSYSLFAGTNDGIFLSTNNGANWNVINSGLTNTYVPALAVSGTNVFAGTYEDCGAFLSTDNGVSWSAVNTGLTNSSHFRRSFIKGTNINVLAIKNTNLFAGTNNGVFLSTNNGTNWSAINSGLTNTCISALAASPSEVAGTNLFAGTEDDGIFISTNSGSSWSAVNTGLTSPIAALAASSNEVGGTNLFVGTYSGVFLSTNNGARWHPVVNTALTYVSAFVVSPNGVGGTNLFAGAGGGVFLSTDIGTSWTIVNTGLRHINVFVVSRYGPGGTNLFAGTSSGGVFLSTDNGANWTAANTGLTDPDVRALTVSSNGARGTNLFAGTWGGGVFLSTDNGASWSAVNSGLPKWPYDTTLITSVNTFEVIGANLFAGTDEGIFLSTDNGTHWSEVNSGLRNHIVRVLAISPATGGRDSTNLFAGTFGSGVWRRPLSEMITTSVRQSSAQAPERFELEQNYPNPFNPSTVISYQLAVNSNVTLKVYDLLGREVAVLVNERKDAGRYSVQWSASRFSSGIYFYFLSAGKFQETKRMILLK